MRSILAPLALVVLLACSKPSSSPATPEAASSASPRPSSASPPDPSAAPSVAFPDAGVDANPACTLEVPDTVRALADVTPAMLTRAIVPSFDATTGRATVERRKDGTKMVRDCHGGLSPAVWEGSPNVPGTVTVIAQKPLPGPRQAVWIGVARDVGACAPEDGYGFFAIVAFEVPRLRVLGVAPWEPGCHTEHVIRPETLRGETVYVESEWFSTGAGSRSWETVWTLHDGELRRAGSYDTHEDGDSDTDDTGLSRRASSTATVRYERDAIVLRGAYEWLRSVPDDAGGARMVPGKREPWLVRYLFEGGKLVEERPPPGAAPHGPLECRAKKGTTTYELFLAWEGTHATGTFRSTRQGGQPASRDVEAEKRPDDGWVWVHPNGWPAAPEDVADVKTEGGVQAMQVGGDYRAPWLPCEGSADGGTVTPSAAPP